MGGYDSYLVYVQWCIDHKRSAPTRAWWEAACRKHLEQNLAADAVAYRELRLDQAEIDREAREGWAR